MNYDLDIMKSELVRDEALRLRPYTDTTGHVTIGVGRNLSDVGISRGEAITLLENDIARTESDLDHALPWWRDLDPVRQRVILNMAFNLGVDSLLHFHNTLAAVQAGQWQAAHDGMLASLWAKQVGPRADRLAAMILTGEAA